MKHALSTVLVLLVLAGCAGPTMYIVRPEGTVWGWKRESAERVAEVMPIAERVRQRLDSRREGGVVVHVYEPGARTLGIDSAPYATQIEINPPAMNDIAYWLGRGATHWYVVDSPYEGLPLWVEVGLGDWIGLEYYGLQHARRQEIEAHGPIAFDEKSLVADRLDWESLFADEVIGLTYLGFSVVDRLGLEEVARLATAGADSHAYLRAARIDVEANVCTDEPSRVIGKDFAGVPDSLARLR